MRGSEGKSGGKPGMKNMVRFIFHICLCEIVIDLPKKKSTGG